MHSPNKKWHIAIMLAFAGMVNYADRAAISAVFPLLRSELALSDVALASLGSVFLWSYSAFSPFAGFLCDRFSRSKMIIFSLASWSLVCGMTGFATSLPQLLFLRVLLGLAECLYLPSATALLAEHHGVSTRGTAMSIHSIGLNLGVVGGGTLAGYLGDRLGWRPGFWVLGLIGLALAAVASFVMTDGPDGAVRRAGQPILRSLKELVAIPSYLLVLSKAMMVGVGVWIFYNWLPLYYLETFHMSLASAGFAGTFLLQAASITGIGVGGFVSDRLAKRDIRNRMLLQAIGYICASPFLLVFLGTPSFAMASTAVFGFALMRGFGHASENPTICDVVPPRLRSTAIGFMNTGATLAGGIGVFVVGFLKRDFGLAGVFAGIPVLHVIAACLALIAYFFFVTKDIERQRADPG
ncbi:MAG: MFS transporter [Bryobacteraceae bacterium]